MRRSNYDKHPIVQISRSSDAVARGWPAIAAKLRAATGSNTTIAVETYPGVHDDELIWALQRELSPALFVDTREHFKTVDEIERMTRDDVTNDPVFGVMTKLRLGDFFRPREPIAPAERGITIVYGVGATLFCRPDVVVYANFARWEIQMRMRRGEIDNLGLSNRGERASLQYKRAYFVDWRVADNHKREIFDRIGLLLDTSIAGDPKMIAGGAYRAALEHTTTRPFRVVPFFDPAPWGGQWMKEVCDLDRSVANFGWCFDCVPEENSLLLGFGDVAVEVPSIDLVFRHPKELLGEKVFDRFGAEFPIRFDFLDTMGGGNLSFQVHPLTAYIREKFGMAYTQDESYYMLDAAGDACVYLGLKDDADFNAMSRDLRAAERDGATFDADLYAARWPAKKHDHFLIPAGTVHCSGANSMVLEISATPYIFTFKLWDWGRMGLDGRPRPTHIEHGLANIQRDRTESWTRANLINRVSPLGSGDGWREERTGLHELEFIETRRHWFTKRVDHYTSGGVNVLNLVEGESAIVESPTSAFEPFIVHYAETFIVPAAVGAYTIRPGDDVRGECATMKAFVRS